MGVGLIGGGYLLAILSIAEESPNSSAAVAGSLMVLGGMVVMIASHSKIGRAGEKLMISSQSLGYTGQNVNSVGVKFRIKQGKKQRLLAGPL